MKLHHGGNTHAAAALYGIVESQWIDLSTGISPWSWPAPEIPSEVLRKLPCNDGVLEQAAAKYYGSKGDAVLAVPGSQYALQHLPSFLERGRVAMPLRGYAEHRLAWVSAGHKVVDYRDTLELQTLVESAAVDHALLINPNNPTGHIVLPRELERLHAQLAGRGGFLVVDEAFADVWPENSLARLCPLPGLVVFRSLGKFFGLAGVRLGFMLAPVSVQESLGAIMSPWMLSHPARWIGEQALLDRQWQEQQRERLERASREWQTTLQELLPQFEFERNPLFLCMRAPPAICDSVYEGLARRGVLIRQFDPIGQQGMLRFGLPNDEVRSVAARAIQSTIQDGL